MSRLLWFVLGGIATAVGAGFAAILTEEVSGSDEDSAADGSSDHTGDPESEDE